eukprot:CFRG7824T1
MEQYNLCFICLFGNKSFFFCFVFQNTMFFTQIVQNRSVRLFVTLTNVRLSKTFSTTRKVPRVCVVGSGPGGFYTAQRLTKIIEDVHVDIIDRLPVPYGLVRFGVAPDHPEVKNVIHHFDKLCTENHRVRFLGNVDVGIDVSVEELRARYSAVVFAYGADDDKHFGIKGEDAKGILSARSFVGWYNGSPAHRDLNPNLQGTDTVVIFGQGNVAIDCARILLSDVDALSKTDVCSHAIKVLTKSKVRKVVVVGRRGPMQAAFTIKELREMTKLTNTTTHVSESDIQTAKEGLELLEKSDRPRKRITELMIKSSIPPRESQDTSADGPREFHIVFHRSPVEFLQQDGHVTGAKVAHMKLEGDLKSARAVPTGASDIIKGQLILRSIGYKSLPIASAPFDHAQGIVPNIHGSVDSGVDPSLARLYCSGWVKTGPVGVILSTMNAAFETANVIHKDWMDGKLETATESTSSSMTSLDSLLTDRKVEVISFMDWKRIEAEEISMGQALGKPCEKITDIHEMMKAAGK